MGGVPPPDFESDISGKLQTLLFGPPRLTSRRLRPLHNFHFLHGNLQPEPALTKEQIAGQLEKILSFGKGQRDSPSTNGLHRVATEGQLSPSVEIE